MGARLEGYTSALMEQKETLDNLSALWTINNYNWVSQQLDHQAQLALLLISTASRVHNTNSIMDLNNLAREQSMSSTETVSENVSEKYQTL